MLVVLSDGLPEGPLNGTGDAPALLAAHLLAAVARTERRGIRCVGIGLGTDAIARFYQDHTVIADLDDVAHSGFEVFARVLRSARR